MKCVGPQAKDADLWILVREEVRSVHQEGMLLEVEHVKAHRSKKEKKDMALFGSLVTEGSERADVLATGGCNAGGRNGTDQGQHSSAEKEGGLRDVAVRSQLSLFRGGKSDCEEVRPMPKEEWISVDQKKRVKIRGTSYCAATRRYRFMRCGKHIGNMKMPGK